MKIFITKNVPTAKLIYKVLMFFAKTVCEDEMKAYVKRVYEYKREIGE